MLNFERVRPYLEVFSPQTNGEISGSIVQNWTQQAVECHMLNSDCSQCSIKKGDYSFACQMPKVVSILKRTHGLPNPEEFDFFTP